MELGNDRLSQGHVRRPATTSLAKTGHHGRSAHSASYQRPCRAVLSRLRRSEDEAASKKFATRFHQAKAAVAESGRRRELYGRFAAGTAGRVDREGQVVFLLSPPAQPSSLCYSCSAGQFEEHTLVDTRRSAQTLSRQARRRDERRILDRVLPLGNPICPCPSLFLPSSSSHACALTVRCSSSSSLCIISGAMTGSSASAGLLGSTARSSAS